MGILKPGGAYCAIRSEISSRTLGFHAKRHPDSGIIVEVTFWKCQRSSNQRVVPIGHPDFLRYVEKAVYF